MYIAPPLANPTVINHWPSMRYCFIQQEPVAIKLGSRRKWTGHGKRRKYKEIDETMMYIPLHQTLKTMLEDKTILKEVRPCQLNYLFPSPPSQILNSTEHVHNVLRLESNGLLLEKSLFWHETKLS